MCLGVPGTVLTVTANEAAVDFWGVTRCVRLDIVDEPVAPGDLVLVHAGFAIRRIPREEAAATLALYAELAREERGQDDPLAAEIGAELAALSGEPRP